MGNLSFDITGNNSDFIQKTEEIRAAIQVTALESEKQSRKIELLFSAAFGGLNTGQESVQLSFEQLKGKYDTLDKGNSGLAASFKNMYSVIGGTEAVKQFASEVIRVRGEFQQLELTFSTLLQSKEKANSLMGEIAKTAAQTPFSVPELAEGAKQLLSYGFEAEEVNSTLLRLGNVASGLGMPLDKLAGLYGSIASQGSLCADDLDQFAASGVPMMQGLADMFGVSADRVNEMVAVGKIGFPEVQSVMENLTNEGGQFYNLMDEQSQTISGKINNLGDAWDMMLNKMGESSEGIIGGSIDLATYLIDNYEQIGKILLSLIETYGAYRVACMANIVLTQSWGTTQIALGAIMTKLRISFMALTKSMNLNPFVLAATALVGLGVFMWNFADRTDAATKAQQKLNAEMDKFKEKEKERKQKAENLLQVIQNETESEYEKVKAYEELKKQSPALTSAYKREELATLSLADSQKILNEERDKLEYDKIVSEIDRTTKKIGDLNQTINGLTAQELESGADGYYRRQIEVLENYILELKGKKAEIDRLREQAREDAKPIETKIFEAKANLEQITAEFEKVEKLLKEEEEKYKTGFSYIIPFDIQVQKETLKKKQEDQKKKVDNLIAAKNILDSKVEGKGDAEQAEKIRNQQKQLNDLLESQSRDRQRLEQDLSNQNRQAEIDAMEEGADKVLEQMLFSHEREMQELDREKKELLQKKIKDAEDRFNADEDLKQAKNPKRAKRTFDSTSIQLSENETQVFNDRESNIGKKQDNELKAYAKSQRQAMNESLKEYGTYEEKRKAITEIYNEKIAKGKTESEKLALGQSLTKELSDLDIEANKATATFSKLFSDMSKSSVKDMRTISKEAKSALEYVKGGKFETGSDGKGKYGISADTFKHLQESPEEVAKMEKGIEGLDAEADKCDTAFNKIAIGFKKAFDAGSDPKKVREALAEIEAGMNEVMQAGQFLSNSFSSLGDALGSETMGKAAEGMNVAMDAAGAAMSGAQAGAMFGPWGAAAGAAIGLVSSLGSSLARLGDAKHEKNIQQIQDKIEVLEKSYDKLGDSIEKSYSSDASKLIEQQNTLLEQQKVLIKNQIAEEQSKKKSDSGRIKDWENQIEEIDKAIAEGKEKAIDVLLGEDVKAAIDNFAQAYADAWSAGDDRAKSSKDLVKQMIKQMIVEAIKATTSAPMEKLRQKLAGYFSDGIISAWEREQIEKDAEAIANELDSKYAWADEYMKGEGDSSSQESTKGGFETMSQETGSELNGRFSAMQVANEEMRISMQSMVINLASLNSSVADGNLTLTEMRNVAIMSNSYLQDIAGYTKRILVDFGVKLDSIITNTKGL